MDMISPPLENYVNKARLGFSRSFLMCSKSFSLDRLCYSHLAFFSLRQQMPVKLSTQSLCQLKDSVCM